MRRSMASSSSFRAESTFSENAFSQPYSLIDLILFMISFINLERRSLIFIMRRCSVFWYFDSSVVRGNCC